MLDVTDSITKGCRQKILHNLEDEFLEKEQKRVESHVRPWLLPCPTCFEIVAQTNHDNAILDMNRAAPLVPCLPVVFQSDELPPSYILRTDKKWELRQGVGPRVLEKEKKVPFRLPSQQFKVILPGTKSMRPPRADEYREHCWQLKREAVTSVVTAFDELSTTEACMLWDALVTALHEAGGTGLDLELKSVLTEEAFDVVTWLQNWNISHASGNSG